MDKPYFRFTFSTKQSLDLYSSKLLHVVNLLSLSLLRSLTHYFSHSLITSHTHSLALTLTRYLSHSLTTSHTHSLSLTLTLSTFFTVTFANLSHLHFLPLSHYSHSLLLSLTLTHSHPSHSYYFCDEQIGDVLYLISKADWWFTSFSFSFYFSLNKLWSVSYTRNFSIYWCIVGRRHSLAWIISSWIMEVFHFSYQGINTHFFKLLLSWSNDRLWFSSETNKYQNFFWITSNRKRTNDQLILSLISRFRCMVVVDDFSLDYFLEWLEYI